MRRRFSPVAERVQGKGAEGWAVHSRAMRARRDGENVVILSVGDPEFPTPEQITRTATDQLTRGDTHYTDIAGRPHLRAAVARHAERTAAIAAEPSNVMVSAGTQNALFNASLCLLGAGDEVLVPDPAYLTYEATLRIGGARLVPVPLDVDAGFRIDPSAFAEAVTDRTRAIVVNSPANPSGSVASTAEIAALADVARRHDLWVISDEVYAELLFDEATHHSIATEPGMAERTVVVGGLSKSHAMTGWRIGWAIGPADLVQVMDRVGLAMNYGLPGFIQEAAVTALDHADDQVAAMRDTYRRRRDLTEAALKEAPGITTLRPQAGMFVVADVRDTGLGSADFSQALFDEHRVSVLDAGNFGPSASGWVRISFTPNEDELTEGLRRLVAFCEGLASP